VLGIFGKGKSTKELRSADGAFEADLFAIVSKKVTKSDAAGLRAEPESMLLVAAGAYTVSSVETCVKSGRKFHSRQDLVAVTHCALAALATSRDLLGLPAEEHHEKRNRIFGVVMPTARWLYGDGASDELVWKICDVAMKGAQAEGANMRKVNAAFSEDFQNYVRTRGRMGTAFLAKYLRLLDEAFARTVRHGNLP
jgi:hypothetical protein